MLIHNYGEVLPCRDIKFEDNKIDLEYAHPGIVLLPTTDKNDEVYCLYMTSNSKRAKREQEKYIKNSAKSTKESYINIQQIVKRSNIKDEFKTILTDEQFEEVLESFYNYQISLNPQKENFLEIKLQVEALLNVLKFNKEFDIKEYGIDREQLDILSNVTNKDKQRVIYGVSILRSKNPENEKVKEKNFINEKYKEYFKKLIKIYDDISEIDFDKCDLENPNNPLRKFYFDTRNNNFSLNINGFFNDVATIFELQDENLGKGEKIKEFINREQNNTKASKVSVINIQQIAKRSNTVLTDEQFEEILESFYKYQISLRPQKQEFLLIKPQVETLLNVLKFNKRFDIKCYGLDKKQLDILSNIPEKDKQRAIYGISILRSKNPENKKLAEKNFINEKYKEYFKKVIKTCDDISEIDFDKLDLENSNNSLRNIYFDIRNNNFLLNINGLFNDVATIFELQDENLIKGEKIKEFIKGEQELELKRAMKKENKRLEKKTKNKSKSNKKNQNKKKREKNKYGNFDVDFFNYE